MEKLPLLTGWEETGRSLHKATQIIGALRMLTLERVPNYLELSTVIKPNGLASGILPFGGELMVDFQRAAMVYQDAEGKSTFIPLAGNSQASLLERVLFAIGAEGKLFPPRAGAVISRTEAFFGALAERAHPFLPKPEDLTDEEVLVINPDLSASYIQALYRIFNATSRFRDGLSGPITPIVVWPEHFDLSFLWFATPQATDDHPHMNFGFAPYSAGLPRP